MVRAYPTCRRRSVGGLPRVLRRWTGLLVLLFAAAGSLSACAATRVRESGREPLAPFDPAHDTFAFPNLVRAERPGLNDGFANYCLIMVRAANQFFQFARFDPAAPVLTPGEYTRLTRQVLAIPPWDGPRPESARVTVPGYPDLRALSRDQEAAVKAAFGSNILSMLDVRLWRASIAFSGGHQAGLARTLRDETDAGRPAVVMITNFPDADLLNHAVLVYGYRQETGVLEFLAYDPNDPGTPASLYFDRTTQSFSVPPLTYSPPGRVRAFRLYTSPLF